MFEIAIVLVEALIVLLVGVLLTTGLALEGVVFKFPAYLAMSAAYLLLVTASDARIKLPRERRRGKAIQMLVIVFIIGLMLSGNIVRLAPWLALWLVISALGIRLWRSWVSVFALSRPKDFWPSRPAAFIGNSASAARLLAQMQVDSQRNFLPVGFFDDRTRDGPLHGRLPYLGGIDELVAYIQDHELDDIFMALPWSAGERISVLIERLRFLPLTVHLVPDEAPPAVHRRKRNEVEGVVMPTLMLPPFSQSGALAKRALDLLAAVVLLIPLTPLFLLVALAIRLDSPGPVFFLQRRSGQYGRTFSIFKFRSLKVAGADAAAETLVNRGDTRVTRVGKYLRKYSIDEMPQIINVFLGHMSLVGPRPHAPRAKAGNRIYAEVMHDYMLRYRVKPGMTGWAQVNGWRGNTDTEEKLRKRVEFDFKYIENWSMLRDIKILMMTIPSALFPPKDNV